MIVKNKLKNIYIDTFQNIKMADHNYRMFVIPKNTRLGPIIKNTRVSKMSWDKNDLIGVISHTKIKIGQINLDQEVGKWIRRYAEDIEYNTYLEIGTWNGYGSTKCFADGFTKRKDDNYIFYSLECNTDKFNIAKEIYSNFKNFHILNEVFFNDMPKNIYEMFPELLENTTLKHWNDIDFENMKNKSIFLNRKDLPEIFDVILLDGGDYTTYYEYQFIKDRCRILILDDTNVPKCKQIVKELKSEPDKWEILMETNERNGNVVAKRKMYIIKNHLN